MTEREHPAEALWLRHAEIAPYPDGVIAVPKPIPGIAFFPGGYGLWREHTAEPLPTWPSNGVMILGHDFHSESGYRESLKRGREAEGLIFTLGKWVPSLLAPLSDDLTEWRELKTFAEIDSRRPLRREVSFRGATGVTVAALTHPSLWHAAVRYRHYDRKVGREAELALLAHAVAPTSGTPSGGKA